jgi:hypothetical protein
MPEKSQIESRKHQDDADIRHQPFPDMVSEEHDVYGDDDGDHRHDAKCDD